MLNYKVEIEILKKSILKLSRINKQIIAASTDFSIILSSFFASVLIVQEYSYFSPNYLVYSALASSACILIFFLMGVYKSVLRFIDLTLIYLLLNSILISVLFITFFVSIFFFSGLVNEPPTLNLGVLILLLSSALIIAVRLIANRLLTDGRYLKRVVIFGAGSAGRQLAGALRVSSEMQPVVFMDSNKSLHNTYIAGIKVLHPKHLRKLVTRGKIDEVLIAIPSASKSTLRKLLEEIENYSIKVRILPGLSELAQGKVLVSELKEVNLQDLLGRFEIEANQILINKNIEDKVVLITGAGGSIGSEISRQVAENNPKKVILLDVNEYALYSIKKEIEGFGKDIDLYAVLASVNNKKRILDVCNAFKVNTVYHAAAYKHVSLVEENPFEAVSNNIQGTKLCAEAAIEAKVETFVLISTDKAVRPTNIMGATKRFAELILQSLAMNASTRMTMVRFGNVMGSSGSAIPLFQEQIKEGGPVTVTHPEVIRYFMSIPEAAELVIQAGAMGKGGDVFVLDMGEPVKIYELARRLINLSGMEVMDKDNPEGDIEIIFTGLRPGEKLYEELLIGDNVSTTEHKQIFRAEEDFLEASELEHYLSLINEAENSGDVQALKNTLGQAVSGFKPSEEIVDVIYQQIN